MAIFPEHLRSHSWQSWWLPFTIWLYWRHDGTLTRVVWVSTRRSDEPCQEELSVSKIFGSWCNANNTELPTLRIYVKSIAIAPTSVLTQTGANLGFAEGWCKMVIETKRYEAICTVKRGLEGSSQKIAKNVDCECCNVTCSGAYFL